ncbi:SubName: Full=Uncharacterized protein {ECO:0000313/EMBL:CCA67328.1} [Serendipita indica DSM 11827]|nr:SubName: Full=Uncharacterized protein {ECO:0000313/EMBL:CCA67328.1} [Serendipita indica DSM 11827]
MSSSFPRPAARRPPSLPATATTTATTTTTMTTNNNDTMSEEEQQRLLRAPRMRTVALPDVPPPYFIRGSLASASAFPQPGSGSSSSSASPTPTGLGPINFVLPLAGALVRLTADEASRPATSPATQYLRIVSPLLHPNLRPIYILPSSHPHNGGIVTVYDVLSSIHAYLHSPVESRDLAKFPAAVRTEALLHAQERCLVRGVSKDVVRVIDLLDGATVFGGLVQQEDVARRYVAPGERGIDGWQSVTWILNMVEGPRAAAASGASHGQAPLGLGPYQRLR